MSQPASTSGAAARDCRHEDDPLTTGGSAADIDVDASARPASWRSWRRWASIALVVSACVWSLLGWYALERASDVRAATGQAAGLYAAITGARSAVLASAPAGTNVPAGAEPLDGSWTPAAVLARWGLIAARLDEAAQTAAGLPRSPSLAAWLELNVAVEDAPVPNGPKARLLDALQRAAQRLEAARPSFDAREDLVVQAEAVVERLSALAVNSAEAARRLVRREAGPGQIHAATRQLALLERIRRSVGEIGRRDITQDAARAAADRVGRDAVLFGEVNNALLVGSRELRIERVDDDEARSYLERVGHDFRALAMAVEGLLAGAGELGMAAPGAALDPAPVIGHLAAAGAALRDWRSGYEAGVSPAWLTFGALRKSAVLFALAAVVLLVAVWRQRAWARRDFDVLRQRADALAEQVDGLRVRLADQEEAHMRAAQRASAILWRIADGDYTGTGPDIPVDPGIGRALDSLAARLRTGLGEISESASRLRGATGLLGEAVNNLEVLGGDAVRGLRDARSVGDLLSESAGRLSANATRLGESSRVGMDAAGASARALEDLRERLRYCENSIADTSRGLTALREAAGGITDLMDAAEELGEGTRMLALNTSLQAGGNPMAEQAAEELTRLAERASGVGRAAATLRDALDSDADGALRAIKQVSLAIEQADQRADRTQGGLGEALARYRTTQGQVEEFAHLCREQHAELRRHIHVLTELAARAEQGRSGTARLANATMRLGDLSHSLEQRTLALSSGASDAGTVVHISAATGVSFEEPKSDDETQGESNEARVGQQATAADASDAGRAVAWPRDAPESPAPADRIGRG